MTTKRWKAPECATLSNSPGTGAGSRKKWHGGGGQRLFHLHSASSLWSDLRCIHTVRSRRFLDYLQIRGTRNRLPFPIARRAPSSNIAIIVRNSPCHRLRGWPNWDCA